MIILDIQVLAKCIFECSLASQPTSCKVKSACVVSAVPIKPISAFHKPVFFHIFTENFMDLLSALSIIV